VGSLEGQEETLQAAGTASTKALGWGEGVKMLEMALRAKRAGRPRRESGFYARSNGDPVGV
jgi:hypothetical protein